MQSQCSLTEYKTHQMSTIEEAQSACQKQHVEFSLQPKARAPILRESRLRSFPNDWYFLESLLGLLTGEAAAYTLAHSILLPWAWVLNMIYSHNRRGGKNVSAIYMIKEHPTASSKMLSHSRNVTVMTSPATNPSLVSISCLLEIYLCTAGLRTVLGRSPQGSVSCSEFLLQFTGVLGTRVLFISHTRLLTFRILIFLWLW